MQKIWTSIGILFSLVLLLSACSVSEERVMEIAQESFAEKMAQESKEQTYDTNEVSIYVPSNTDVVEIDEYNLLLEREGHIFLLFLNDLASFDEDEQFLDELMIEEEPFIFEMDKVDGKLGYFLVTDFPEEEGKYTVVVGYEGAKITTITSLSDMNNIAEMMFDIVQSVEN